MLDVDQLPRLPRVNFLTIIEGLERLIVFVFLVFTLKRLWTKTWDWTLEKSALHRSSQRWRQLIDMWATEDSVEF